MTEIPSKEDLVQVLSIVGSAHHDYQSNYLKGVDDEQWAGFYAAYVLGSLGDFVTPSKLTLLLEESPNTEYWALTAAEYVLRSLHE